MRWVQDAIDRLERQGKIEISSSRLAIALRSSALCSKSRPGLTSFAVPHRESDSGIASSGNRAIQSCCGRKRRISPTDLAYGSQTNNSGVISTSSICRIVGRTPSSYSFSRSPRRSPSIKSTGESSCHEWEPGAGAGRAGALPGGGPLDTSRRHLVRCRR